jgi:Flp pilus assembly protein TadG
VAAIEFGLAAPFLMALLLAITELGLGGYQAMQVADAAEAGALYAAKYGFDASGIQAAVVNAVGATSGVTATPAPVQFCGCPDASGITAVSCSGTCTDGSAPGSYIRVYAAIPHETIFSFPLTPLPSTFTAQSTVRAS